LIENIEAKDLVVKSAPSLIAETAEYNPLEAFTQFKSVTDPTADLYRETPVRLLGYANEATRSASPFSSKLHNLSDLVTSSHILTASPTA